MIVLGLMSGTSVDGVDAAITDIRRIGKNLRVKLLSWDSLPYSPVLKKRILAVSQKGDVKEICHLNVVVGEVFAKAALKAIKGSGIPPHRVKLIGSHGQTIQHRPHPINEPGIGCVRSTLQIGEPAVIAERTGIPTIANFRARDLAAGGEGAPLAPYAHHLVFGHRSRSRVVVNLGGIANATLLPAGGDSQNIQAFDTGPCNMLLDGVIERLSGGKYSMDRGGKFARRGRVDHNLLRRLLAHPFILKKPPKSTGREEFGQQFIQQTLRRARRARLSMEDTLATCTRMIAASIYKAQEWMSEDVHEVIAGGGGVHNSALMAELKSVFNPISAKPMEEYGVLSKAFEAEAFAVLAYQTFHARTANVPFVTGARHSVILGSFVHGIPKKDE